MKGYNKPLKFKFERGGKERERKAGQKRREKKNFIFTLIFSFFCGLWCDFIPKVINLWLLCKYGYKTSLAIYWSLT